MHTHGLRMAPGRGCIMTPWFSNGGCVAATRTVLYLYTHTHILSINYIHALCATNTVHIFYQPYLAHIIDFLQSKTITQCAQGFTANSYRRKS